MASSTLVNSPLSYASPSGGTAATASYPPSTENLATLLDRSKHIKRTLQIHACLLRCNLHNHTILSFKLHRSYSSLGYLNESLSVFSQTSNPNVYFYTSVIQTLIINGLHQRAIAIYAKMLQQDIIPNKFTLSSILKSCPLEAGKQIQGHAIKLGLHAELYVRTCLLDVYSKFSDVNAAQKLFDGMPEWNIVSRTSMISCYTKSGMIEDARMLFDELKDRDEVAWNVMITGYVQQGLPREGLTLFRQMLTTKVRPTAVTIVAALSACAHLGALESGRWIHSYVHSNKIPLNVQVSTALIDMYGKCGSLEDAEMVFARMIEKDVVAWNSIIMSYAINGCGRQALELFDGMISEGHKPTDTTFIGVLHACGHSGLVNEGRDFFQAMKGEFGIQPKVEHYGCMANLLGRAGHLEEALKLIMDMEVERDSVLLSTLLGACKFYGNIELGTTIAHFLINQNLASSGTYILLSNMHAAAGNWRAMDEVRSSMKENGLVKEPGFSSIEMNNILHEFLSGDCRHSNSREIYAMLETVDRWIKSHGNTPHVNALHYLEDE